MKRVWIIIPLLLLTGCLEKDITKLDVKMINDKGDSVGTVKFQEVSSGIKLTFDLKKIPPGEHAVHIHDKGECKTPEFKSSGKDLNPDDKKHGLLHPEGAHEGDLPNIIVEDDGTVKAELMAPRVTLKEGKATLIRKDGTTIVIHEEKDDGMSQPEGDSGGIIACGKISKEK
ncbi:superoxide dismutase family protein [Neobacillus sp. DY30]|uniref:superoxide dismutase family protein n=1 Tax=Neobacillus sp. DY30 TaxID=3047871 RepID=UPI0024C0E5C1|nr:superoxide dismutase family protein [Neobacillus sp. DY30]WHX99817.1 superoxide dismutase family protein [Neobacillus sp. DY30]